MTYDELVAAVSNYSENNFPTDVMDTMIRQAEQRIYNTVQLSNLRKNVTSAFRVNNKYLAVPSDFLSAYSLAVIDGDGDYQYLLNKDVNFIREAYPKSSPAALPKHYALFGPQSGGETTLTLLVGPTPDAAYSVELHYFYYPDSIVQAKVTWLGNHFDSALLNATLLEAMAYMKGEPDLLKMYQERYASSIALLKNLSDGKQRMDAYRDGQLRIQVN